MELDKVISLLAIRGLDKTSVTLMNDLFYNRYRASINHINIDIKINISLMTSESLSSLAPITINQEPPKQTEDFVIDIQRVKYNLEGFDTKNETLLKVLNDITHRLNIFYAFPILCANNDLYYPDESFLLEFNLKVTDNKINQTNIMVFFSKFGEMLTYQKDDKNFPALNFSYNENGEYIEDTTKENDYHFFKKYIDENYHSDLSIEEFKDIAKIHEILRI
jgi:hypothetical protein